MRPNKKPAEAADVKAVSSRGVARPTRQAASKGVPEGSEMMHIRIDRTLKANATKTLEGIGLSLSDAVRLFLNRVVIEQALPLQLAVPNATTRAAIESARTLGPGNYSTAEEMFDALEKAGER